MTAAQKSFSMSSDVAAVSDITTEMRLGDIVVEGRHRVDLGDIKGLAASIDDVGLIHPVVVTPDLCLVAGERRITAARSLGWDTIPAVVIHTLNGAVDQLRAERDENRCRKDFSSSELVALGRQLEELERPKAQQRQHEAGGDRKSEEYRLGPAGPKRSSGPVGKVDKVVGEALGVSQSTYKRLKQVDRAQSHPDPEVAALAQEQMAKLDAGETSPSAAARAVREKAQPKPKYTEPEVIPGLPTKRHRPRPRHDEMLHRVAVGLEGTCCRVE